MIRSLIVSIFGLFFVLGAQAQTPDERFGLAMHGAPKYGSDDAHLDYVNSGAPKGGTLKMAMVGAFDTVNPYSIKGKAAQGLNLVYDRLMGRVWDEPFTLYPLIADRVTVPDDRSGITIHVDPQARFHDGSPITADDVIFSFETLRDHGRPNMRQIYKLVETVERPDDRTVVFRFGPGYDRETVMIIAMMPVLSKTWWSGRTFDSTTLDNINSNGPYRIKKVDPGRKITYERNSEYWASEKLVNVGHHNFDEIIYEYYRDDSVAFEAFKAGDLDLRREFDAGHWASAYDFPLMKAGEIKAESLPHGRPERARGLIFNTRREPFNDPKVRQALTHLLDFEWLNQNLFYDQYRRINSCFPNSELAAQGEPGLLEREVLDPFKGQIDPAVFGPSYQPPFYDTPHARRVHQREADRLLKEAGWGVENGVRVKNGQAFKFEMVLDAPEDEKIALHFKQALDKMGVQMSIRVLDSAAYHGRMTQYDFDMTIHYWLSSLSPGTEQPLYWGCKAADEPARWNYPGICDPAIDHIASHIAAAESRESLVAHVRALDRLLTHGHYMIPLYYLGKDLVAYKRAVHHPDVTPLYGMVLETWWMDQASPEKQD